MISRMAIAGLALGSCLLISGAASAQYYEGPYGRGGGYGGGYGRGYGGGRFDCNPSRCIDRRTGALWESTCNYGGCGPLRPARQHGYGRRWRDPYDD